MDNQESTGAGCTKFIIVGSAQEGYRIAREHDGMIVAMLTPQMQAVFGEDPARLTMRVFIDAASGLKWLKARCREYAGREDVDFLVKDDALRILPAQNMPSLALRMKQ